MATNHCPCEDPKCPGLEKLREFTSWTDLTAHCGENTIVRWVNELAVKKEQSRFAHRQYNEKKKLILKTAQELLSPAELTELKRQAVLKAEEGIHE